MAIGQDIFNYKRDPKPFGVFSSENSILTFADMDTAGRAYLVQDWRITYTQNVQELFEIGSNRIFWVKGRPQGEGSIGRIVGGVKGGERFFPKDAYDICDGGATATIKAVGGHCDTSSGTERMDKGANFTISGLVVTSFGFQMQSQNVMLQENYGFRFAHLSTD